MIRQNINQWWIWLFHRFLISSVSSTNNPGLFVQRNLPRVNKTLNVDCRDFWSCSSGFGNLCYCDDLCLIFNDCCLDQMFQNSTIAQNSLENNVITYKEERLALEEHIRKPLPKHLYACTYDETMDVDIYTVVGCPEEYYDNYVRKNCEQPNKTDKLLHVPVSGVFPNAPINSLSVKFYNLYCAICHRLTEYTFWNLMLVCNYERNRKYPEWLKTGTYNSPSKLKNDCNSSFAVPQNVTLRQCQHIIDTCPANTSDAEVSLCTQGPLQPIMSIPTNNKFKNIDCAFCHNVDRMSMNCFSFVLYSGGITNLYNYYEKKEFTIEKCDGTSIRDPYTNTCRRIHAPRFCNESNLRIEDPTVSCPDCKLIRLHKHEYSRFENYIHLNKANLTINESLLYYIDNTVYICSKHYIMKNTSTETDPLDEIEYYITMFGLSLSILALFVTFCVYASFRSLRNVPGKMSMNLVASMFVANLLFTLKNLNVICILVAVSMHYTYLVSFFWMNALSFDAWNTFSKTTIGGRSKHCYKYYLVYCWITPLLIVSVSIFVQFTPVDIFPSWMSPKYGPPLCWISNKWALFIFFAAPLFLLILCNVVFYMLTIRAIYRTEKISDRILSKKKKGMFLIYLKLCFIMGINWIFALLHTLTGLTTIRFISVFLNSFQGFWVGCSYLFSKQIWRQLKSKITFLRILKGHTGSDDKESKQTSVVYLSNSKGHS